jgi:hypothetical protein
MANTGDAYLNGRRVAQTGEVYTRYDSLTTPLRPDNNLRVANDPSPLFYETFDAGFDAQKFTLGGTVVPTQTNGVGTVSAGTVAGATSILTTVPTFPVLINMYNTVNALINVDAGLKTGCYRFCGFGTPSGSPTAAIPLTNAVGFSWDDSDGKLYGVVWSNGVQTASLALNAFQPTDNATHRYLCYYKSSRVYFEIDGVSVGSIAYPAPQVSNLPMLMGAFNGLATVTPAATFTATFLGVADSGSNSTYISDGSYGWRKTQVGAEGGLSTRHTGTFQNTYVSAFNVAVAATATDIATITGSSTKTIYIQHIIISGIQTTTGTADISFIKRSTVDTGGTSTAQAIAPHDSANAAATATVLAYTANPAALGTAVGNVRRIHLPVSSAAAGGSATALFDFGDTGQALILRGVAQQLAINLNGATLAGGAFNINIEWYEI